MLRSRLHLVDLAVDRQLEGHRRTSPRWSLDRNMPPGAHVTIQAPSRGGAAMNLKLTVNGKVHEVSVPDDMPLLWALRDVIGLTGTKFGCGMAQCGACTVLVDGSPVRSCVRPAAAFAGRAITTIEGLSAHGDHPVQRPWTQINSSHAHFS